MDIGENQDGEILTTKGLILKALMVRKLIFEDRPNQYVVAVEWVRLGELVRRDALVAPKPPTPGETASMVNTIYGLMDITTLDRHLTYTESEMEFTVVREMYYKGEAVRRDAHVILKRVASDEAISIATAGRVG